MSTTNTQKPAEPLPPTEDTTHLGATRTHTLKPDLRGTVFVEYLVVLVLVSIATMIPMMLLGAALFNYFKANRIALTLPLL